MKIQFSRTGGIAGIRYLLTLDLDQSPRAIADAVRQLVEQAKFFELQVWYRKPLPDQFQYWVSVEDGIRSHQVRADESALPNSLRPLVERLLDMARAGSGDGVHLTVRSSSSSESRAPSRDWT